MAIYYPSVDISNKPVHRLILVQPAAGLAALALKKFCTCVRSPAARIFFKLNGCFRKLGGTFPWRSSSTYSLLLPLLLLQETEPEDVAGRRWWPAGLEELAVAAEHAQHLVRHRRRRPRLVPARLPRLARRDAWLVAVPPRPLRQLVLVPAATRDATVQHGRPQQRHHRIELLGEAEDDSER